MLKRGNGVDPIQKFSMGGTGMIFSNFNYINSVYVNYSYLSHRCIDNFPRMIRLKP